MSARDLGRLVAYHLDAWPARGEPEVGPLDRATVRESHVPARLTGLRASPPNDEHADVRAHARAVGYAWGVSRGCNFDHYVWHNGGTEGHRSIAVMLPRLGIGVVLLANHRNARIDGAANEILQLLVDRAKLEPRTLRPFPEVEQAASSVLQLVAQGNARQLHARFGQRLANRLSPDELQAEMLWWRTRGECERTGQVDSRDLWNGAFGLSCTHGAATLHLTLSPVSQEILSFTIISEGGDAPTIVRARAEEVLALQESWSNDRFADAFADGWDRDKVRRDGTAEWHKWGTCRIASVQRSWRLATHFRLDCERGHPILAVGLTKEAPHKIAMMRIRPAEPEEPKTNVRCR